MGRQSFGALAQRAHPAERECRMALVDAVVAWICGHRAEFQAWLRRGYF